MQYLISQYWIFIALAVLLGLFVGWSTRGGAQERAGWLYPALGAWAVGLLLAILKIVPGAPGHALEVALLLFAGYIVGCFAGSVAGDKPDRGEMRPAVAGAAAAGASPGAVSAATPRAERTVASEAPAPAATPAGVTNVQTGATQAAAAVQDNASAHGMTDGQRSLIARQKKDAERAARTAASVANAAPAAEATAAAPAAAAPVTPAARRVEPAHAPMTDGARTLAVLKRKDEERALRRAAAASQNEATATAASTPEAAAPADDRPAADAQRDAPADDLKLIKGIGPKNAGVLDALGVRRFDQIADWSDANARWVGAHMSFPGRVEREHWIAQAKFLAAGLDTEHSAAVKAGRVIVDENADAPLNEEEAQALGDSLPKQAARVADEDRHAGSRPLGLADARGGGADDLKLIKGIGPQNEARLHGLGVWHFDQIAAWTPENVRWVGSYLAFVGRIDREKWIEQAKALAGARPQGKDPTSRLI